MEALYREMVHYAPLAITVLLVTELVIPQQELDPHTKQDIVTSMYDNVIEQHNTSTIVLFIEFSIEIKEIYSSLILIKCTLGKLLYVNCFLKFCKYKWLIHSMGHNK